MTINKAFVFVNTDSAFDDAIYNSLKTLAGIKDVYKTNGTYDLALRVETDSVESLRELIENKIRKSRGIASTSTLVVVAN